MTDIQPSPPGYRGQDEAPGPLSCSPGSFKYAGHAHHPEHKQQQSAGNYVKSTASTYNNKESYNGKQSNEQQSLPYRRKSENSGGRRTSSSENEPNLETNNHIVNKKSNIAGYNDGYKKNTPGYKNDSGYSESIGFDSFSLPLNERDDASPPPTPPVRDASSLKGVCYGPGHEKYPSWPSAPERHPDEETSDEINGHGGSHRSKSWTDHTNYPKEKPAQYTRPLAKRPNPAFTQQLKTVMERCEKIPAETFESRGTRVNEEEPRLWPRVDREGKPLGDSEYVVPSPPEREQQQPSQTISHAELEAYVRSYQDPQVSQVDVYRETALTQAGLEEYTRVQHSQQASYAQSEGYHSYVSSVDSNTNTPFLDRLRRDSEAVAQRPSSTWEEGSREGRDSVVTTSSGGSASSSETLKWHGSMSDVSVSSGIAARQGSSDRWDRGSMSDVSSVNGLGQSGIVQKAMNHHEKWQSSMSDLTTSLLSPSSRHGRNSQTNNKWKQEINNKWQTSMNDRNCAETKPGGNSRASLPAVISHCSSVGDVHRATSPRDGKWQESSIDEENLERNKVSQRNWESTMSIDTERYSRGPRTPESQRSPMLNSVASNLESSSEWTHGSMSDVSQSNLAINSSKQLIAHSARVQTPQRHHSESVLYLDRERTQRKLYPISTTKPEETNNQNQNSSRRTSPVSPQQAHLSVAERISELEKAQQTRYTYLDPEKRHRVSDPTLKAIQKKALLSFYERHQHQSSWRSEPQLAQSPIVPTAQSPPPQPPPRPRPPSSRRASSASDYSSGTWREKTNRPNNSSDLPIPKHQHSNSCGSLSTDLLGPVIVGPAISIDDWVPERPPKKPHLRGAFNDRVPSPDLPPPSPPTVEETEVLNCDDPLPPPPPELSDSCDSRETSGHGEKRHRSSQQSERQSRRSKHGKRSERDEKNSKSSPLSSPITPAPGKSHHDDSPENFVRGTRVKHAETDVLGENGVPAGFATHRVVPSGRSSLRYPAAQKLVVNGRVASSRRSEERRFSSRPPARLPDLVSQRYSDSGNQRPAPQVPVETRIIRQESMRVESTRLDASGLLRTETCQRYETSTGQRPQPQVPICNNASDKNTILSSPNNQTSRPNHLPISDTSKISTKYNDNPNYSVGSPVKTGYEANSKLMAEASPQKYHEPPKYSAGHHQRHNDSNQRYCYALANKYIDIPKQKPQPQCPTDRYSTVNSSGSPPPPPLAPRQNTPGRKSLPPPPRPAPPLGLQGSQSKASYLAYRRERGAPDSEGSYKRTMSPTARLDDWHHQNSATSRDQDDPVLLRVTPHHAHQSPNHQTHNSHSQQNSQQINDLPKSHSVDALHQRIEERSAIHSNEVMTKLSRDLTKKLHSTENRGGRTESNNNDKDYKERLSPQSIEVLNDRNRQLERERRKLAASCEPLPSRLSSSNGDPGSHGIEDFYRERSATIEMTSRNVELLNRRNALAERRTTPPISSLNFNSSLTTAENPESETRNLTNNSEKPPAPLNSPPRSPSANFSSREDASPASLRSGAVPRRTGSCSSSSSTSTRSSNEANPSSRSSPRVNHKTEASTRQHQTKVLRDLEQAHGSSRNQGILRRKISSPSQTENSWTGTNSPRARSSQTEVTITNASLRRTSSSRSRSSSLSSAASKISTSSSSSSASPRYSPVETKNSPCVSPQPGIEGLTLLQRSEIILRVNSTTIDASSQTEIFYEDDNNDTKQLVDDVVPLTRRKLPEEIECEELSRDLANQLAPNDKLVPILLPAPEHKKPTDYVTGLFRVEATLQPRPRRPTSLDDLNSTSLAENETEDDAKNDTMPSTPTTPLSTTDSSSPLSPTSAYFTTSEGKARFLTRYSRDVTDVDISNSSENSTRSNATNNANDSLDLRQKKEELVLRLDKKVLVLRAEQEAVREEGELNEALGARVSSRVSAVARPAEASKYRLHVEEVGKITSLLLGLSGRLARAENALYGMPADHPERKILESKRDKLMDQLEEAKILKSNIDKRSVNVSAILSKYLNDDEYADYQHFINMKAKLIMDGREIQDKVKLGEEQLAALKEAID